MDVFVFVVGLLLLCLGDLTTQFPQDLQTPNAATVTQNSSNAVAVVPCATARGIPGSCIDRQYCDYSTYAIDLSLYAPKAYKKPCLEKETCCPFSSQIQTKPDATLSWNEEDILFDDED